ncbi:DUF4916 domain-containing protein [Geodermatophilus sp. SYSU D00804]
MPGGDRPVWCQHGGRVRQGESLRTALLRHLHETLSDVEIALPTEPQPTHVVQWFPNEAMIPDGLPHGHDPPSTRCRPRSSGRAKGGAGRWREE